MRLARRGPAIQIPQFYIQNRGLNGIQARIDSDPIVEITPPRSVHAQRCQFLRDFRIVGRQ